MLSLLVGMALLHAGWEITQQVDPITDNLEVRAVLRGDNAQLIFTCSPGTKPMLIYAPETFLGGGGSGGVQYALRDMIYRFDQAPAKTDSWKYLHEYAVPYSQKATVSFVTSMIKSKRLILRAERYDHAVIDSTFDLEGSAQAFSEAFKACQLSR